MTFGKRIYWVAALVAVMALAGAGVAVTSRITSAGGPDPTPAVQASGQQDEVDDADEHEADDAAEHEADDASESATKASDTDTVEEQSGDQNEADDVNQALE